MEINEIYALLKKTGFPVAYDHFNHRVSPPYIAYCASNTTYRGADGKNNVTETGYRIELYTEKKDADAEKKLEQILPFDDIEKQEIYIEDDGLFEIIYEFETIEKTKEE